MLFLQAIKVVDFKRIALSTFGMRKGLPYRPFFNFHINKMRQNGLLGNIIERNALKKPQCPTEDALFSIHFLKMVFPFTIFLLGVMIAIAALLVEEVTARKKTKLHLDPDRELYQVVLNKKSFSFIPKDKVTSQTPRRSSRSKRLVAY